MPPVVKKALRSRWFVACAHAGLWLLLYLAITNLGGKAPDFRDAEAVTNPPQSPAPVAGLEQLFSPGVWPKSLVNTNALNPFFTPYFIPPATAAAHHPQDRSDLPGLLPNRRRSQNIVFKLDDAFMVAPIGARIATNLFIADATMQALTLTNLAAQTNILLLNAKKEIVVPIR